LPFKALYIVKRYNGVVTLYQPPAASRQPPAAKRKKKKKNFQSKVLTGQKR